MTVVRSSGTREQDNVAVFVLWQSLVVKAYRSFFSYLTQHPHWRVACASPQRFRELGSQNIEAEPFEKPFSVNDPKYPYFLLKTWNLHVQIVLFKGLGRALKGFFAGRKDEKKIFLCIADPYSLTAFFAWWLARIYLGKNFKFVLFASQNIFKRLPLPLRLIQSFLFKRCDAILSIGREQDEVLRKHGYTGQIFDFPLWFDSKLFLDVRRNRNSISISSYVEKFKLGYAGSLSVEKGILDLLHCFEQMLPALKDRCSLQIAGSGPLKDEVIEKCHALKSQGLEVSFLGPLSSSEMRSFYLDTDILLVPSRTAAHWKEQFGRVIVEAQACGVMVLGSNSGAIPNVIHNTEYVFREGDISDMSRVISHGLELLQKAPDRMAFRTQMGDQAFQRYSDEVLAEKLIRNLSSV